MSILSGLKKLINRIYSLFRKNKQENEEPPIPSVTTFLSDIRDVTAVSLPTSTAQGTSDPFEETKKLRSDIEKTKTDVQEALKRSKDTHSIVIVGFMVLLFMLGGLLYDYFYRGEQRYEKFIDKTVEMEIMLNNKFYSKEDLKVILEENKRNTKTLDCLKYRRYFDNKCFE